jgi:N-acetyl-gamma-glutamyl-phosphate reductase
MSKSVGIMGGTGFTGVELIKILNNHPEFELRAVGSQSSAGINLLSAVPNLFNIESDLGLVDLSPDNFAGLDLVFMALPHNTSAKLIPDLFEKFGVSHIVDLSADFRLKDSKLYDKYYGFEHPNPGWLKQSVFGLPEVNRNGLYGAQLVAAAGCYVTAVSLAVFPFISHSIANKGLIIADCASGVTGAGKKLTATTQFTAVNENFSVYGLLNHRHRPEIEQVCGRDVLFTPHLLPIDRGILATCYFSVDDGIDAKQLTDVLYKAYNDECFVKVCEQPPDLKSICNTNYAAVYVTLDEKTNTGIVISAIDNLMKGASGQAVQCANAIFGFQENLGF